MNHNEMNKNKKEILKSYTDYSGQKGTWAKIEQYKKLLDFLIMDCKDLMVEEIRRGGSIHEDDLTEERIEEELEEELENLEYKKPEVSPCDNEELSKLYAYDHGLIIPDELKSLYEKIGFFSIGDDPAGLYMFNPKRVLFAKDFNTFVPDADYFNGFKDYIDKDRCDFLSQIIVSSEHRVDLWNTHIFYLKSPVEASLLCLLKKMICPRRWIEMSSCYVIQKRQHSTHWMKLSRRASMRLQTGYYTIWA